MSAQDVVFAATLVLRIVNQGIYDSCLLKHKGRHRVSVHEFSVHSQLNTIHTVLVSCTDLHLVVGVNATVKATPELMPAFLCSLYGPALDDVIVPEKAPKLFIGVHADHPSVAAGCLALFMEWKKAGVDAELHIYGDKTGGLFGGGPSADKNTPNGSWQETFYSWLIANEYTKPIK